MANQVSIAVETDVAGTTKALTALNKQFTDAGTKAGAALNSQITPALKNIGDEGESSFDRVGSAANRMSMNVYYASYAFMPFAGISPIFGFLSDAISGASGALSLMGPILETVGSASTKTAAAAKTVGAAVAASSAEADAALATQAAAAQATADTMVAADEEMAAAGEAADAAMGPLGLVVAGVGVAAGVAAGLVGMFSGQQKSSVQPIQAVTSALEQQAGAFGDNSRAAIANQIASDKNFQNAGQFGLTVSSLTDGLNGNNEAYQNNVAVLQRVIDANTKNVTVNDAYRAGLTHTIPQMNATAIAAKALQSDYENQHASILASVDAANTYDAAIGTMTASTGLLAQQVAATNLAMQAEANAASSLSNANLTAATSQTGLIAQMQSYNQTTGSTKQKTQDVVDVTQDWETAIDELSGNLVSAGQAQDQFQLGVLGLQATLSNATPLKDQTDALSLNTVGAINNKEALLQLISQMNQAAKGQLAAGASTKTVTATLADNEKQLRAAAIAAGLNATEVDALMKAYAVNPTQIGPKAAADEAAAAAKQTDAYSGAVDNNTHSMAENNAQLDNWLVGMQSAVGLDLAAHKPLSQINTDLATMKTAWYNSGEQMGLTKQQLDAIWNKYGQSPTQIDFTVALNAEQALSQIGNINDELAYIANIQATDPTLYKILSTPEAHQGSGGYEHGGVTGAAAGGGPRSNRILVGEHGPEVVDLAPGSNVHSNPDSQRMMSGGGGGQFTFALDVGGGADSAVGQLIQNLLRSGLLQIRQKYVTA